MKTGSPENQSSSDTMFPKKTLTENAAATLPCLCQFFLFLASYFNTKFNGRNTTNLIFFSTTTKRFGRGIEGS